MKDGSIMVIGIAGGTGSGKTTITRKIMQHFGGNVSVIYHDNYYKAHHGMSYEERAKLNYDHPDAFDTDLLIEDIKRLRRGETVHCPTYDYTIHDRAEKTVTVRPARVIIVEGILIFQSRELCDLMDIKIYVDTDADVRILRRIVRDVRDRGRSLESENSSAPSIFTPHSSIASRTSCERRLPAPNMRTVISPETLFSAASI